jgi:hypothetical protein
MELGRAMSEGKRIDIGEYLSKFEPEPSALAKEMRQVILDTLPGLDEVIKWGHLVYEGERMICSIMVHKKHINLQIWRGNEIEDPRNLLEGTGKSMRHVKVHSPEEMKDDYFKFLLEKAIELE